MVHTSRKAEHSGYSFTFQCEERTCCPHRYILLASTAQESIQIPTSSAIRRAVVKVVDYVDVCGDCHVGMHGGRVGPATPPNQLPNRRHGRKKKQGKGGGGKCTTRSDWVLYRARAPPLLTIDCRAKVRGRIEKACVRWQYSTDKRLIITCPEGAPLGAQQ